VLAPKPVVPAAPNVPVAPNDGATADVPNRFVDCVVAVAPNKPYTVPSNIHERRLKLS